MYLCSNSGNSSELKNIINYANRYKIKLIGIVKKISILYKAANIKLLIPEVKSRLRYCANIKYYKSISNWRCLGSLFKTKNISYVTLKDFTLQEA